MPQLVVDVPESRHQFQRHGIRHHGAFSCEEHAVVAKGDQAVSFEVGQGGALLGEEVHAVVVFKVGQRWQVRWPGRYLLQPKLSHC